MEFFITPTSSATMEGATNSVVGILNATQEASTNKMSETTYKDDYFSGLFDSRDKRTYLVFSDIAKAKYGITESLMDITPSAGEVDLTGLATEEYVNTSVENVTVDLEGYATETYVDDAIANIPDDGTDTYVID